MGAHQVRAPQTADHHPLRSCASGGRDAREEFQLHPGHPPPMLSLGGFLSNASPNCLLVRSANYANHRIVVWWLVARQRSAAITCERFIDRNPQPVVTLLCSGVEKGIGPLFRATAVEESHTVGRLRRGCRRACGRGYDQLR